jgi:arylformamidase
MQIYDISVTISPELPVWPGDPKVVFERVSTLGKDSDANVSRVDMSVHTGTHIDAPSHFIENGGTVDEIPLKQLTGRAYVLHLPDVDLVTADALRKAEIPPRTRRVLIKTRNSLYWENHILTFQTNYVAVTPDGARFLIDRGVKLVGVDYLSIAPYEQQTPTHREFLNAGVVVVEGLNLSNVSQGRYTLYCLPLKMAGLEGAPARAILIGV